MSTSLTLLTCFEVENLAIVIINFFVAAPHLHRFLHFCFSVFWAKLLQPPSFLLYCACFSFLAFVTTSYDANYVRKQIGTHRSFPWVRALRDWCAVLLSCHHVDVSRRVNFSATCTFQIHSSTNLVKQAHFLSKLPIPGQFVKYRVPTLQTWFKITSDSTCIFFYFLLQRRFYLPDNCSNNRNNTNNAAFSQNGAIKAFALQTTLASMCLC